MFDGAMYLGAAYIALKYLTMFGNVLALHIRCSTPIGICAMR